MHTAICAFDDKQRAREAVDSLVRAGFARDDLHIEHRHAAREDKADANDRWDGMEREIAVDRSVLSSFGHFFASLFGRDNGTAHADTYSRHVERGGYVVVVDTHDAAEAERARLMLQDMRAGDLSVVERREQTPLRDIVGMRQSEAEMERSREAGAGAWTSNDNAGAVIASERDRAMASNVVSPRTGPDLRDPDIERAPGLRYSDKDKPLG